MISPRPDSASDPHRTVLDEAQRRRVLGGLDGCARRMLSPIAYEQLLTAAPQAA
jgi:hypothetical protein